MKANVFGFIKSTLSLPISIRCEEYSQFNGSWREEDQFLAVQSQGLPGVSAEGVQ